MTNGTDQNFRYRSTIDTPVIGMESEFLVVVDGKDTPPEEIWRRPSDFIDEPVLPRTTKSSHLPTGGAVYFDRGVIEVVTPLIELAPAATARMTRSLWEQVGFVRSSLDGWERRTGHTVALRAFSAHYNISFELRQDQRSRERNIQKLALLLTHLIAPGVIVLGGNRRSTGVGVRPRRDRLEVTADFTPDPALMAATAAFIVGIVREVISWPDYRLSVLDALPVAVLQDVQPGRHTTRKGWLLKDYHFAVSPFTSDVDAAIWKTADGRAISLRDAALQTATFFSDAIARCSDPYSHALIFDVLRGEAASLLDLDDRPPAYDEVGRICRWGRLLPELFDAERLSRSPGRDEVMQEHLAWRESERKRYLDQGDDDADDRMAFPSPGRRASDPRHGLLPPWAGAADRRGGAATEADAERRSGSDRRKTKPSEPLPEYELSRSTYELLFIRLGRRERPKLAGREYEPVSMKGWYHVVLQPADGGENVTVSIEELLRPEVRWRIPITED